MTGNEDVELGVADDTQDDLANARRLALLAAATAPTDWRSLPSGEAVESWENLREWVRFARREFVLDHRVVPPCWYRHPALVSVLSALHDHWRFAYDPLNSLLGPSDWHRAFMQLEQRLRDWASRTGCTLGVHRPDVIVDYADDDAEWHTHVAADSVVRAEGEATDGAR